MSHQTVIALHVALILLLGVAVNVAVQRGLRALADSDILSFGTHAVAAKVARWIIIIVVALLVIQKIGISVHAVWASMSAFMVLVAVGFIAFWSMLSNVSAALLLVLFAPFRIGDEIEIMEPSVLDPQKTGLRGRVIDISFLYTTLAEDGEMDVLIRLPNNLFFQKAVRCRKGKSTQSLQESLFHREPR